MSVKTKRFSLVFGFIFITLIGFFFLGAKEISINGKGEMKEINLVAEGMVFKIQESAAPIRPAQLASNRELNLSLTLTAGEVVRIVVRNEDPGILHDFAIKGVDLRLPRPLRYGESAALTFTVPAEDRIEYFCTEHPEMMRGEIIIRKKP